MQTTEIHKAGSKVCDALFFGSSALRNRDKTYREGPIEALRGVMSDDADFLAIKDSYSREASKRWEPNVDEFGRVFGNGIRSNWYGLRYVGGYPSIPATYPMVDNSYLREQKSLKNDFVKPWHENTFRSFVRLFFSNLEPQALRLRNGSSSMMPFYETRMSKKKELALFALENGQRAGELMLKGDFVTPWTQMYIGGAYHTVYRRQSSDAMSFEDGVFTAKARPVGDLLFAISGGREGKFEPTNRNLILEGKHIPAGFFRERNRTAMGGPLGLNANLMVVAQPVRKNIYTRFAYTFHHTTRAQQQADIRKNVFFICADVSNHDWYWPTFVVKYIVDELSKMGWPDWWLKLFEVTFQLPNFVTDVGPGHDNVLIGDWREPQNNGGLPSGNAFTDLMGSLVMTWAYHIMMVEHTYPECIKQLSSESNDEVDACLESFLRGEQPITLKDKSDDAVCGWTDSYLVPRAKKLQAMMIEVDEGKRPASDISPYMIISYEKGGAFLGSIMLFPSSMDPKDMVMIGNNNSMLINQLSPEYGVQSDKRDRSKARRPYPGLAWKTLSQNYGTCPLYQETTDLLEFIWARHKHESYSAMREQWYEDDMRQLRADLDRRASVLPDFSPIEIEVLNDPSRLDWKYDDSSVSSDVLNLLFNGLPLETTEPFFNAIVPMKSRH